MSKDRKPSHAPGRKSGARINQSLVTIPFNVKLSEKWEMGARSALVALNADVANQDHLIDLYTLADIADRISKEPYIKHHASAIKRICYDISVHDFKCGGLTYQAMLVSTDLLLGWLLAQRNYAILKNANHAIRELALTTPP